MENQKGPSSDIKEKIINNASNQEAVLLHDIGLQLVTNLKGKELPAKKSFLDRIKPKQEGYKTHVVLDSESEECSYLREIVHSTATAKNTRVVIETDKVINDNGSTKYSNLTVEYGFSSSRNDMLGFFTICFDNQNVNANTTRIKFNPVERGESYKEFRTNQHNSNLEELLNIFHSLDVIRRNTEAAENRQLILNGNQI